VLGDSQRLANRKLMANYFEDRQEKKKEEAKLGLDR